MTNPTAKPLAAATKRGLTRKGKSQDVTDAVKRAASVLDAPKTARGKGACIQSGELSFHARTQQGGVMDLAKVLGNVPHIRLGPHPSPMVEPRQIHRACRIRSQTALPPQIEVVLKVRHRQFPQRPVNRLPVAQAGVVRFRHRSPSPVLPEDSQDVIVVPFRFQIDQQRRKAQYPERGRGKQRPLHAMRPAFAQHHPRRITRRSIRFDVVADLRFKESLHSRGRLQGTEGAHFLRT